MSRNKNTLPTAVAAVILIGGLALYAYEQSQTESPLPAPTDQLPPLYERPDAKCHMKGLLPDPICTPGAANPAVTPDNILQTICVGGYSHSIRPPTTYTNRLKFLQMKDYGFVDSVTKHEEDHLISLQLGGSPDDPHNLWPEPGASPNQKDSIERILHKAICSKSIGLREAQRRVVTDWTTAANGL